MSLIVRNDANEKATTSGQESGAIVVLPNGLQITEEEHKKRVQDAEELEEKLKYITEKVPTRIMNVSGSNAGAGSGEFHMYRMARRREQMRLTRIDEQQREDEAEKTLEAKRKRLQELDDARTVKRRAKREKKKSRVRAKKTDTSHPEKELSPAGSESDEPDFEQPALD